MITRLYQLWLVLAATLIVNLVACIILFASGATGGLNAFITSLVYVFTFGGCAVYLTSCNCSYMVVIPPLSFLSWYRYVGCHLRASQLPRSHCDLLQTHLQRLHEGTRSMNFCRYLSTHSCLQEQSLYYCTSVVICRRDYRALTTAERRPVLYIRRLPSTLLGLPVSFLCI